MNEILRSRDKIKLSFGLDGLVLFKGYIFRRNGSGKNGSVMLNLVV